jgi:hypothetical protein
MQSFLENIYPHGSSSTFDGEWSTNQWEVIQCGAFALLGPQKQRIRPQYWSRVVEPQWEIELLFNDPILNSHPSGSEAAKRMLEDERAKLDLEKQKMEMEMEFQNLRSKVHARRRKERVEDAGLVQRLKWALSRR